MNDMNDLAFLQRLWWRSTSNEARGAAPAPGEHQQEIRALYARGIFMDEAFEFLFQQRPTLEAFDAWLAARTRPRPPEADIGQADVLTPQDLQFWEEHGYLVLRGAVPPGQCAAASQAIWDYLGASPDDAASWYQAHPGKMGLMLRLSDHPALDLIRHAPRIRRAYEQLYRSRAIYPTIDKVSFNPPETAHSRFAGSPLHWDVSLAQPIPYKLQGLLYLGDCGAADGAFHCVPGFQHAAGRWLETVPAGVHPRAWAIDSLQPVAVEGRAGDFVIWQQALPHCATANRGAAPRLVQYLTYLPDECVDQQEWI